MISLTDLVQAKKTQRDKDWSMLRRLIEANHAAHREAPTPQHVEFWLRESRTATMLVALAREHPDAATALVAERPLLALAASGDVSALEAALLEEANREREADRPIGFRYAGSWKNCGNSGRSSLCNRPASSSSASAPSAT